MKVRLLLFALITISSLSPLYGWNCCGKAIDLADTYITQTMEEIESQFDDTIVNELILRLRHKDKDEDLGFLSAEIDKTKATITEVEIVEKYRRLGCASMLIREIVRQAIAQKCSTLVVSPYPTDPGIRVGDVKKFNKKMDHLYPMYAKLGFTLIRKFQTRDNPALMTMSLVQHPMVGQ